MTQAQTAAFTNTLTAALPTRARTGILALSFMGFGLGVTSLMLFGRRRRKREEG